MPRNIKSSSNLTNLILYSTESITGILFSLVSISLIARHFGPENLARFSVAQSVSTVFMVLATLGVEQYILREMTRNKADAEFATSILFGMLCGWLGYVVLVGIYYYAFESFSKDIFLLINIFITTLLLKVVFLKNYLQAQNKPKPIAVASLISRIVSILYLLTGTYFGFSFDAMMIYMPLQALVLTLGMAIVDPEFFHLIKLRHYSTRRLLDTLREALPLIGSTILYFFYSQSSILLMSNLLPAADLGKYSAAIRLIPQGAFIGYVIVATFYKELDRKLLENRDSFNTHVKSLLTIQFGAGIIMAGVVSLTSELIVSVLYGPSYQESSRILAIASWAWVFILPAALYSRILIMLGLVRYELLKMLIIAPTIVLLNYYVILHTGIIGSAIIFVISYFLVDFLVYFIFKETRLLGRLGFTAIYNFLFNPIQTLSMIRALLKAKGTK